MMQGSHDTIIKYPPLPVLGSRTTPFTDRYILAAAAAAPAAGWSLSVGGGMGCNAAAATLEELWLLGRR